MKILALVLALVIAGLSLPAHAQIENWSIAPDSNSATSPLGFPEGMAPSGVNNSAREVMAEVRRLAEQSISGMFGQITGETPNAFRMTPFIAPTTGSASDLPLGAMYWFQAATDNSGAVTLQVSGYTAAAIEKDGAALVSGDIVSGDFVGVIYDGSQFQIISAPRVLNPVTITGGTITGITDLVVADGGTGVSTFTDGGVLLGSGTGAITAMGVLADGAVIVGDGTTDPGVDQLLTGKGGFFRHDHGGLEFNAAGVVDGDFLVGIGTGSMGLESGATARTTIGIGTGDNLTVTDLTATGAFTSLGIDDNANAEAIDIDANEIVTMPKQSGFVVEAPNVANLSGDGTTVTLIHSTERIDKNADHDGTSTFTAPVTGLYLFCITVHTIGYNGNQTTAIVEFVTSNRTYRISHITGSGVTTSNSVVSQGGCTVADMDAADTITATFVSNGSSKVVDTDASNRNMFTGTLLN
jgi:hypothetical protein